MRRAVLLLTLAACQTYPKKPLITPERKEFIHHMGHNQKLAFELQSETGEPLDQKRINEILDKMISHFESARRVRITPNDKYNQALDDMFGYTLKNMRYARAQAWSKENIGSLFDMVVNRSCMECHERFAP